MYKKIEADIVILGGGITGLWLLSRLRQQGYAAILLETGTLGGGQTHKSQGILHGGMKYALQGKMTEAATATAGMPALWRDCLAGQGPIDLSAVPVLSPQHYLWTTGSVTSKISGFFAGMALQGKVKSLARHEFPAVLQHKQFRGSVYALHEEVIDVHALLHALVKPSAAVIFHIDDLVDENMHFNADGSLEKIAIHSGTSHSAFVHAKKFIFSAGSGNQILLEKAAIDISMQRRPLHMVMLKHDFPFDLYAHCLGPGAVPRLTITTHRTCDRKKVWYLGGQMAEKGIQYDQKHQCKLAREELKKLFPWLDFSDSKFSSFMIDRAEIATADGKRPDSFTLKTFANCIVAWPTKLVFAPALAETVLREIDFTPSGMQTFFDWPMPDIATPVWDKL